MASYSEQSDKATIRMVFLALIGFIAITIAALALLEQVWPTVSALVANPQALLKSSMSIDSPVISVTVAILSLVVALISVWSIGSLLVAEIALRVARRRETPIEVTSTALKFVSPLTKPLVRKRLASLALTTAIVGTGVPAFAAPATEIPTDLGWHSNTSIEEVVSNPSEPSEMESNSMPSETGTTQSNENSVPQKADSAPSKSQASGPSEDSQLEESKAQDSAAKKTMTSQFPATTLTGTEYVVKEGDSLWSISSRHFGVTDPAAVSQGWHQIYELNKNAIGESPNLIHPGTVLNLPQE